MCVFKRTRPKRYEDAYVEMASRQMHKDSGDDGKEKNFPKQVQENLAAIVSDDDDDPTSHALALYRTQYENIVSSQRQGLIILIAPSESIAWHVSSKSCQRCTSFSL